MFNDLRIHAWPNHDGTFSVVLSQHIVKRNRRGVLFHKRLRDIPVGGPYPSRKEAVQAAKDKRDYLRLQEATRLRLIKEARANA